MLVACVSVNDQTPLVPSVLVGDGLPAAGRKQVARGFQNIGAALRTAEVQGHAVARRVDAGDGTARC